MSPRIEQKPTGRIPRDESTPSPMSETLTLELPLPPNMANGRMHWRAKDKARQAYFGKCRFMRWTNQIPDSPPKPMQSVTISATLYLGNQMDDDNALARIKWAVDWCKQAGYIVDDKRPHARFTIPEQVIDRKNQRLVLTLSPAPHHA